MVHLLYHSHCSSFLGHIRQQHGQWVLSSGSLHSNWGPDSTQYTVFLVYVKREVIEQDGRAWMYREVVGLWVAGYSINKVVKLGFIEQVRERNGPMRYLREEVPAYRRISTYP